MVVSFIGITGFGIIVNKKRSRELINLTCITNYFLSPVS